MNRSGEELLARSRFSLDEHRGVGRRDELDALERRAKRGAFAQDLTEVVRESDLFLQVDVLGLQPVLQARERTLGFAALGDVLRDRGFPQALALNARAAGIDATRVTVEIVESSAPDDASRFAHALVELREMGFKLALDDIGLGHSNLKMFVDLEPHYFKIDRYFVHQVERNPYRLAVLACLAELGRRVGARVVAEGVESDASLTATLRSGIRLVQGILLARPLSAKGLREHPLFLSRASPLTLLDD